MVHDRGWRSHFLCHLVHPHQELCSNFPFSFKGTISEGQSLKASLTMLTWLACYPLPVRMDAKKKMFPDEQTSDVVVHTQDEQDKSVSMTSDMTPHTTSDMTDMT